jgi:hypothetical protein
LLGDRQGVYDDFMNGCRKVYGESCDLYENDRIVMNLRQPQSMVNYTSTGFKHIKAPDDLYNILKTHWELNKDQKKPEVWAKGNIYINHWDAPTYMVSVEDEDFAGAGQELKEAIWDAAKPIVEEWTGMELQPTSLYGIRAYTEGAVLNPHADRVPLVSSCIVNVAQDVDEDWVLEIYDRAGNAVNVTMEPGDMVLYESGSLIHGRPFPLKGRYYANIFIHFEPTGRPLDYDNYDYVEDLDEFLPPYIVPGSPEEPIWREWNPTGWHQASPSAAHIDTLPAFAAAAKNDVEGLIKMAADDKRSLTTKDRNGWQPIHEAARGGHKDALDFLIRHGADINARTHKGTGVTPLYIALNAHDQDHPAAQYLIGLGAMNVGPEL